MSKYMDEAVERAAKVVAPDAWERGASLAYRDRSRATARSILEAAGFEDYTEVADAYWRLIEDLQALGERFGCTGGENRLYWLSERLERLKTLESLAG